MSKLTLSHFLSVKNINYPIFTDKFLVLDLLYFIFTESIKKGILNNNGHFLLSDDAIEYLFSILEKEDQDNLWEISEAIREEIIKMRNSEEFSYLVGYDRKIENVSYRYLREEKYVRFYVQFE